MGLSEEFQRETPEKKQRQFRVNPLEKRSPLGSRVLPPQPSHRGK